MHPDQLASSEQFSIEGMRFKRVLHKYADINFSLRTFTIS